MFWFSEAQSSCHGTHRYVNLEHCLIQQTREKGNEVFGVLKERIFTTQHCSIMEKVKGHGSCGTGLTFFAPQSVKVGGVRKGLRVARFPNEFLKECLGCGCLAGLRDGEWKQREGQERFLGDPATHGRSVQHHRACDQTKRPVW